MTDNAVLCLRAERLSAATRPFLARGSRIVRCQHCLLPQQHCLCGNHQPQQARSRFCLVMFDTEPLKPSNTGRLIADILPETQAFAWSRTTPPQNYSPVSGKRITSLWLYSRLLMHKANGRYYLHHPVKVNRHYLSFLMEHGVKQGRCFGKAHGWMIFRYYH